MNSIVQNTTERVGRLTRKVWRTTVVAVLCWGMGHVVAWGEIKAPLYVGNLSPILNEYGRPMPGSRSGESVLSRVEIRVATDGLIRPPALGGNDHPQNLLLSAESVGGVGMNAANPSSGLFCMIFAVSPSAGTKLFARVYNAPTVAEASFYVDSELVTVSAKEPALELVFGEVQALDNGDEDGDGLSNSWEQSLGTRDQPGADFDGDGMSDLAEWRAGTDAANEESNLRFELVRQEANEEEGTVGTLRVRWQSSPGKSYQLQHTESLVGGEGFVDVGEVVTAQEGELEIDMLVELDEEVPAGAFRVKLAAEEK